MVRFRRTLVVGAVLVAVSLGCLPMPSLSAPKGTPPGAANAVLGAMQVPGGSTVATMGLRYGLLPRLDVGVDMDVALRLDARLRVIGDPYPLDADIEVGAGMLLFLLPFRYVGFGVGVSNEAFAPYIRYRYCSIPVESTDSGFSDASADHDVRLGIWWAQVSVGAEIRLGDRLTLVPEYTTSYNFADDITGDDLDAFSVGLRFGRW